jgi:peptidoglycan/LPS O-acetylase OafA/YrhL
LFPSLVAVVVLRNEFSYSLGRPVAANVAQFVAFVHGFAPMRVFEVGAGAVAALLVRDHSNGALVRFCSRSTTVAATAVLLLVLVELGAGDSRVLFLMSHGLLLPLLLVFLVGLWANRGVASRVLGGGFWQRAGKASLLLYFIHVPVAEFVDLFAHRLWKSPGIVEVFVISFATTIAAAFALQPYYDAFTQRLTERLCRDRI